MKAISLDKRANGKLRARWTDEKSGKRISFDTGSTNREDALRKAGEELARRKGSSVVTSPLAPPLSTPGQLPAGSPSIRRPPLAEALTRVLHPSPPAPGVASDGAPAAAPAVKPDAVLSPDPGVAAEDGDVAKLKKFHELAGKLGANLGEGALKLSIKWAGRTADDMDDDSKEVLADSVGELVKKHFGTRKITPETKFFMAMLFGGATMYLGGEAIPKPPKAAPLKLVADDPPGPTQTPDNGGGHGG